MKKLLLTVLLIATVLTLVSCGGEKINWDDMILGEMLPVPPANKGEIHENSSEELWIEINGISDKQFADYVEACKEKGFTVDAESDSSSYDAYNAEGYKLSLSYYDGMDISLETPMEMDTITWPTGSAGEQLPAPKSAIGNFSYEYDDSFFVYVGNTSKTDYAEYVTSCSEKGFNVDYNKGDDYYYADNAEGWSLSLCYEGNNTMSIGIDAPSEEDGTDDTMIDTTTNPVDTETETTEPETTEPPIIDTTESTDNEGLDPDFKAAMDSYENFMDEYVEFMKKYMANPTDLSLLSDYADYMSKYADFVESFEKWENEEMNAAETAYYIDVQARVSKKLLEVAY